MRIFIGIFPPKELLDQIRDVNRLFYKEKRNLKFVAPENLHLTLKFLDNDVSEESREYIIEHLERHQSELVKPEISLGQVHFGFKGQIRATTLFISVVPNLKLDTLATHVNNLVKDLDLGDIAARKDRRKLTHHITIARAKPTMNRNFKKKVDQVLDKVNFKDIKFQPEYISVIKSELKKEGPKYSELARIKLH